MAENSLNIDPTLVLEHTPTPLEQSVIISGTDAERSQLSIFELTGVEPRNASSPNLIAVSDTDVLSRLSIDGIDGMKDGETVIISPIVSNAQNLDNGSIMRMEVISRVGDTITSKQDWVDTKSTTFAEPTDQPPLSASSEQIAALLDGLNENTGFGGTMGQLSERGDRLGATSEALGFASDREHFPTPQAFKNAVNELRAAGVLVSPIHISEQGVIPSTEFVETFAAGEFPVSRELGWYSHDVSQEHFRPLLVFREDATIISQLYAGAALASETIVGQQYPDQYEINKSEPQKVDVEFTGEDRIGYAASCLDRFTSTLDRFVDGLDTYTSEEHENIDFKENHMDVISEMVRTIMSSPEYAEALKSYLDSIDSHAFDSGEFSYETFMRELVQRAQVFWDITPKPKPASDEQPQFSDVI